MSYTWDNNGNLTNRGSDSFAWDYEDRMTSATVGGTTWSYAYRGDGLRDSATSGGVTRGFTWDVNAGLPVILDDGSPYIYGAGLVSQVSGANTYYYLADGLGSTLATTDSSGAVVNSYTYDVYCKTTASSGSQANEFQLTGQQTDPTGLQYLRARYYDPEVGGFLSRDPLAAMPARLANAMSDGGASPAVNSDPAGNICVGPVCADGDGLSVGGHEVWEGASTIGSGVLQTAAAGVSNALSATGSFGDALRAAWNHARAQANAKMTALAFETATSRGGDCSIRSDLVWVCTRVSGIRKGAALTIGNVIMTGEKSVEALRPGLLSHELQHTVQWALVGLVRRVPGSDTRWCGIPRQRRHR